MEPLRARLKRPGILLADGAMGTMLLDRGLIPGDCPEKMNLERPEAVEEVTRLYISAGAEIVQTNTFGGSPLKLAPYGVEGRTDEINARAVALARNAAGDRAYLAASCGPSGKILEPYGDTAAETVFESFRMQMKALAAEGVDMFSIETMTDLAEAVLAVRAAKSVSGSIPVSATMTFDETPRGFFTIMGNGIDQAVKALSEAGAQIIGSNCGNGIVTMVAIAREFMRQTAIPVVIRSNAGIPKLMGRSVLYPDSPEFMARESQALIAMGVKIIGGCCGTTPEHIAAIRSTARGDSIRD